MLDKGWGLVCLKNEMMERGDKYFYLILKINRKINKIDKKK